MTIFSFAIPRFVLAQGPPDWVADELLVGLRPGVSQARAQAIYHPHGAAFIDEIPQINTHLIRVPAHALEKVQQALSRRPEVEFVEKNQIFAPDFTPDDPYYPNQWHLPQIKSPQVWDITQGAADIIIAVLDSGVDALHPDLEGKLVAGAAAAAGNNAIGVAGVAWWLPPPATAAVMTVPLRPLTSSRFRPRKRI